MINITVLRENKKLKITNLANKAINRITILFNKF